MISRSIIILLLFATVEFRHRGSIVSLQQFFPSSGLLSRLYLTVRFDSFLHSYFTSEIQKLKHHSAVSRGAGSTLRNHKLRSQFGCIVFVRLYRSVVLQCNILLRVLDPELFHFCTHPRRVLLIGFVSLRHSVVPFVGGHAEFLGFSVTQVLHSGVEGRNDVEHRNDDAHGAR